jgi:hypothetical protein
MAEDPWQKPIKDLKSDLGKARKDIDDVDKRLAMAKRSEDQESLGVHKRLKRLRRDCADLDKRLTVTIKRLDQELADIHKRLKALELRLA